MHYETPTGASVGLLRLLVKNEIPPIKQVFMLPLPCGAIYLTAWISLVSVEDDVRISIVELAIVIPRPVSHLL